MPQGPSVFEILVREPNPAADAALVAALDGADLVTAASIVQTLLLRDTPGGLRGLLESFHLLDEVLRQEVVAESERLFGVLRPVAQSRHEQSRLNVLELIRRGAIYRAAYLTDALLRDPTPTVRKAAAETICALAERLLATRPVPPEDSSRDMLSAEALAALMEQLESFNEDCRQVAGAIETALLCYESHLDARIVEAALWFVDHMGPKFWSLISAPGNRIAGVIVSLLATAADPRLAPFAMQALNYAKFRPHVARLLGQCQDQAFLAEWVRQSWRIVSPKIARGMAGIRELACVSEEALVLASLPPDLQRHVPRFLMATGLAARQKTRAMHALCECGEPQGRLAAAWSATRGSEEFTPLLRLLGDADDEVVARIARRELARRRPLEVPLQAVLADRPGADASRKRPPPPPVSFERYWNAFDRMTEPERVAYGRRMIARTPMASALLRRHLASRNPDDRLRAIRIISLMNLLAAFEDDLYQLGRDADPQVRSAAVAALGRLESRTSRRIVNDALHDIDRRVEANAVEAVAQRADEEDVIRTLLPKLSSPDNRVRANAIKALLQLHVRDAAETLLRMLADENRMHRISALWLIERMGLFTLAARVLNVARDDRDPQVQQRARQLASELGRSEPRPSGEPAVAGEAPA